MVRPNHFSFNEATAGSNVFQTRTLALAPDEIHRKALLEFEALRMTLEDGGVSVIVFDDTGEPHTPDAIFPNNWFSTHADGTLVLYPMERENRRHERRDDIVRWLEKTYRFRHVLDLTGHEQRGQFLEGTGSMVLDRQRQTVFACRSSRTNETLLREVASRLGIPVVILFTADVTTNEETGFENVHPLYHTNVMMSIGASTAVICSEAIRDSRERGMVMSSLWRTGLQVVEITTGQLRGFAGNMLQLRNSMSEFLWVMSSRAFESLSPSQRRLLLADGSRIIHSPLDTIELVGGGSARCMLAEIFSPVPPS
jgi:hypothetical protein